MIGRAKAIVLVTHDLTTVTEFCNRALLMEYGKILYQGTPQETVAFYRERVRQRKQRIDEARATAAATLRRRPSWTCPRRSPSGIRAPGGPTASSRSRSAAKKLRRDAPGSALPGDRQRRCARRRRRRPVRRARHRRIARARSALSPGEKERDVSGPSSSAIPGTSGATTGSPNVYASRRTPELKRAPVGEHDRVGSPQVYGHLRGRDPGRPDQDARVALGATTNEVATGS